MTPSPVPAAPTPRAQSPIEVAMTKWGDRPHWRFPGYHLGSDQYGEWLGFPKGTHFRRPGMEFHADVDSVTLVPPDAGWMATFHAPGIWVEVYVDMTTPPVWDGTVLRSIDLDLDVIRRADGSVFVDDEDEFLEHQVAYGYPPDVIASTEAACREVYDAVTARRAPYDGSAAPWLERTAGLAPRSAG